MENEGNVNELVNDETQTEATEQKETNNTTEKTSPISETEVKEANPTNETEGTPVDPVELEPIQEVQAPQYTSEIVETQNFKLQISHQITAGDMLVSMLLATNIIVILLCRLIRDRK